MIAVGFLFVRILCDCFKSRQRLDAQQYPFSAPSQRIALHAAGCINALAKWQHLQLVRGKSLLKDEHDHIHARQRSFSIVMASLLDRGYNGIFELARCGPRSCGG
jgi:hypothetical protein